MKLIVRDLVPPGMWRYECSVSGRKFGPKISLEALTREVRNFRQGNGMPWDQDIFEVELCGQLGIEHSHCGEPPRVEAAGKRSMTLADVLRFIRTVNEWMWRTKFAWVSLETAQKRASICEGCDENGEIEGCSGCFGVLRKLQNMLPPERQNVNPKLKNCLVCGCSLALKIHLPTGVGKAASPSDSEFPNHCWFVQEHE